MIDQPAVLAGKASGCPFCTARSPAEPLRPHDQIVFLSGQLAGELYVVSDVPDESRAGRFYVFRYGDLDQHLRQIGDEVAAPLPLGPVPPWIPPLPIKYCYEIDRLAEWACSRSLVAQSFHWKPDSVAHLAASIWQMRLPVSAAEISVVMMAHGMPSSKQHEFENLLEVAVEALVLSRRRKPLKLLRQGDDMAQRFANAMRFWGR